LIAMLVSARFCSTININNIHIQGSRNSQDRASEAQTPTEQHGG
jgi:hypothetical protein